MSWIHTIDEIDATDELKEEDKSGVKITGSAASLTENPELNFTGFGTIKRAEGSWHEDGFKNNDYIVIEGAGVNNGVYQINDIVIYVSG